MIEKNLTRLENFERIWNNSKLFNFYFVNQSGGIFLVILENPSRMKIKNNVIRADFLAFSEELEFPDIPREFERLRVTNDFSNAVTYLSQFTELYVICESEWLDDDDEAYTKKELTKGEITKLRIAAEKAENARKRAEQAEKKLAKLAAKITKEKKRDKYSSKDAGKAKAGKTKEESTTGKAAKATDTKSKSKAKESPTKVVKAAKVTGRKGKFISRVIRDEDFILE